MRKFKAVLTDTSLFRRSYIVCLLLCNVTPLIPIYAILGALFIWGVFLVFYNEIKRHTFYKTRYGMWLGLFLFVAAVTFVVHLNENWISDVFGGIMLLQTALCFFVFYSVHTEKHLNFRREFYSICSFVVYSTTVMGIIALACLMAGIRIEMGTMGFIIFEDRFTGLYMNPNYLGYIAVFAIFCCHALTKKEFVEISGRKRVSRIWLGSCVAVNAVSLLLCDSNASMVLMIGYATVYCFYKIFCGESGFEFKKLFKKTLASLLAGIIIVSSLLFVRHVVQLGFSQVVKMTSTVQVMEEVKPSEEKEEEVVTFKHTNTNVDSGRITLWKQAAQMFTRNPLIGVGRGNIYYIGKEMFKKGLKFSGKYGTIGAIPMGPLITDFHNGYIMILVCYGALGFLLFCIFGVRFYFAITRHILKNNTLGDSMLPCMYSFLCAYLVFAMVEITLLSSVTFMTTSFWMLLGYASCFLTKFEPDHPIRTFTVFGKRFRRTLL